MFRRSTWVAPYSAIDNIEFIGTIEHREHPTSHRLEGDGMPFMEGKIGGTVNVAIGSEGGSGRAFVKLVVGTSAAVIEEAPGRRASRTE